MSASALQDDPTARSDVTATPDLEWLSLDDGEEIRWASTPHKYSLVPALIIGIPLSIVLIGIPILVASYFQYTNTNYVVTNRGLYSKRGILSRDVKQIGFDKVQKSRIRNLRSAHRWDMGLLRSAQPVAPVLNSSFEVSQSQQGYKS